MSTYAILAAAVVLAACAKATAPSVTAVTSATTPSIDQIPAGYRDWKLVSVAREEGQLDDVRAILGNDLAIAAYRSGASTFPDGAIIARLAWSYEANAANNEVFGQEQSFTAGAPKNGVQFMIKDSKRYASTGGWGYSQFDDGVLAPPAVLASCFPCHDTPQARDSVFTRYAR